MEKREPFIHLMKSPYACYVYDVNTNVILRVKEEVFNHLKGTTDINSIQEIESLKSKGFLSDNRPEVMEHPQTENLEYLLSNKLSKITLQVTQQCNLRCSYCIYSEEGNSKQRQHSTANMSFETAKKVIDFYLENARDSKRLNIGFYGGEPLLEFELIKKCIDYSLDKAEGKNLSFSITTNCTLLDLNKIEYLSKINIAILVSLDGPEEIHNKQRRFSNGKGSHSTIIRNLNMIKERYPEFYSRIRFNAVLNPEDDFNCISHFFDKCSSVCGANITTTVIDDKYSEDKVKFTEDYRIKREYELFKVLLNRYGYIDSQYLSKIGINDYNELNKTASELRPTSKLPKNTSHSGPCIPGQLRLFVDVHGVFYPCERVSEMSSVMSIGDIENGFNLSKASKLLNIATLTEDKCKKCWAIRHCKLCAADADAMDKLSGEFKVKGCDKVRNIVEASFLNYIAVKEIRRYFGKVSKGEDKQIG